MFVYIFLDMMTESICFSFPLGSPPIQKFSWQPSRHAVVSSVRLRGFNQYKTREHAQEHHRLMIYSCVLRDTSPRAHSKMRVGGIKGFVYRFTVTQNRWCDALLTMGRDAELSSTLDPLQLMIHC